MKKIFFIAMLMLTATSVMGQRVLEDRRSHIDTTRESGEHSVGWLRSHIMDNWFMGLNGGVNMYMGFEDNKGPLLDRFSPQIEGIFGRWIFPMVGIKANLGFANATGFVSKDSYLAYRSNMTADYGHCWGLSSDQLISGNDTINGSLGGYFWPVDDNDNIFRQEWKYIYGGLDFVLNFSYLKRYDRVHLDKKWNHWGYVGFHVRIGVSENHPEKFSNFIGRSIEDGRLKNSNFAAEGHIGYSCLYSINNHWSIMGDARMSIIEGNFDRERIEKVEIMSPDIDLSVRLGIVYNFNLRSKEARLKYYVEKGVLPYNADPDNMPRFVNFVQVEDVDYIQQIDTIYVSISDTINSTEVIEKKQAMERQRQMLIDQFNSLPQNLTLDNILGKRLVPYEMVFFERDKWDIRATEEIKIAKMARVMKAFPEWKFILYGSADSKTGTVKRNDFLSRNRADVVYHKLVYEYGIPKDQLKREYLGGILNYDPYILNRTTVIIMEHPAVINAFEMMKSQRQAGGRVVSY